VDDNDGFVVAHGKPSTMLRRCWWARFALPTLRLHFLHTLLAGRALASQAAIMNKVLTAEW